MRAGARMFNPSTREVIRRAESRTWVALLTSVTLLMGAGCGVLHHELPVVDYMRGVCEADAPAVGCAPRLRTSVAFGAAITIVFAMLSVVVHRRRLIRPTVTCESCGGVGWVMDLEPLEGRCPHCAHDGFTYRAFIVRPRGEGVGLQ
jgi:hypothetical protein